MEYKITEKYQKDCIDTIKRWVSVPSVLDEEAVSTPFGEDIQKALELALETCETLGFKTFMDPEGYYGYAEIGEGEELMAILCHLDVVPVGDESKWTTPAFEADVRDGKIYGRGTQDDKGPSVAALYAVYALIDQGYQFDKRVRFIFGTDEETLWREMAFYNENEEKADFGFVPDADFPLTYAEKGLLQCYVDGPGSPELNLNMDGAFNVVPEEAIYQGKALKDLADNLDKLGFDYEGNDESIKVIGKSIHSKDAEQGINAITRLVAGLEGLESHPSLDFINKYIGQDANAKELFGQVGDEMSGNLTVNVAKLIVNDKESKIGLDLRIPVTADKEKLVADLEQGLKDFGLTYNEHDYLASLYVPIESELVQTLLSVYRDMTGDQSEPISSGGATFARTMENCVAFGARRPDVPVTYHEVDENMPLDNIYECMEIYAEAVKRLATK